MKRIYRDFLSAFMWICVWAFVFVPRASLFPLILLVGILLFILYLTALKNRDGTGWGGH